MTQELRNLALDLRFTGRYATETEAEAALRRIKRNQEASFAMESLLDRVEKAEKDAERLLPLLKQAHSVVEGSYSEEYDQGFEELVSAALFTEIQAMEASK